MRKGRPIPVLTVTPEEREALERWARRPKTAQALAQRAQLILRLAHHEAEGWQVAKPLWE